MPKGQDFYNPYRLVQQPGNGPVTKYHPDLRTLKGYLGRLTCRLDVYTPLEVNYAANQHFNKNPQIPGSSLKGMLRSIAEFIGRGCMSIRGESDEGSWKLCDSEACCPTCDMFGRMTHGKNGQKNRGKIRIDDAMPIQFGRHDEIKLIQGTPKETHVAFYPKSGSNTCYRKLYHHHTRYIAGMKTKDGPIGKMQPASIFPVSPGSTFRFEITFDTLDAEEVGLLAYTLELEPGLLHKLGRGKGRGLGSVKIRIESIEIQKPETHFAGKLPNSEWPEDVSKIIARYRSDTELDAFRKMTSWDAAKNIQPLRYPGYQWFKENSQVELRQLDEIIPNLPSSMKDPALPSLASPARAAVSAPITISAKMPEGFDEVLWSQLDEEKREKIIPAAKIKSYRTESQPWKVLFDAPDSSEAFKRAIVCALRLSVAPEGHKEFDKWARTKFGEAWILAVEPETAPTHAKATATGLADAQALLASIEDPKHLGKKIFADGKVWHTLSEPEKQEFVRDLQTWSDVRGGIEQLKNKLPAIKKYL